MRNERPDLLEIIFEHRNKEYGAYALRRGYASTMSRSLFVGVGLVMTAAVLLSMRDKGPGEVAHTSVDTVTVAIIDQIEKPKEVKPPPQVPDVHTVRSVIPKVVPDPEVKPQDVPPPVDSLEHAAIGTQNVQGAEPASNVSAPAGPSAASEPAAVPVKEIYDQREVEEPAEFPGGTSALGRFLQQRLQDPRDGSEEGVGQVKVKVMFVVNAEGEVGAFKSLEGVDPKFSDEVVRVLRKMPRWKPARQKGRAVSMYFMLPVVFDQRTE